MNFSLTRRPANEQRSALTLVAVHEGPRLSPSATALDGATDGKIELAMRGGAFEGKAGQLLAIHAPGAGPADRILLVGMGKQERLDGRTFSRAVTAAMDAAAGMRASNVASYLGEVALTDRDARWQLHEAAMRAHAATYRFEQCKGKGAESAPPAYSTVRFPLPEALSRSEGLAALASGKAVGQGLALAKDLGNLPANICTPTYLADRARTLAREHQRIKTKVLTEAQMRRLGMGSLLSVAAGSQQPPRLICMEYRGGRAGQAPVALVGKGVTFDTGGISLKPAGAMDEMKFDMCGAASVFGVMEAVAAMELKLNVVGIVPATENMPGGNATRPGDIVTSMDGQTIEILNTDAEGRLILCDAITYATRYSPAAVVDIATLTGACVVALGAPASGLFANDQDLADELLAAGETAGDRAWQLPLWEDYDEALKSNFADVANVGGREAGAVTAACFLGRFAKALKWAHMDIAGSAWLKGKQKGSTGRPVPLLVEFLRARAAR